ncbi:MAG: type II toxin-antitoxin system HicB family antitoxin [Bacteroidales bacterium]|nr:type II toxin-antitoxin system HicB family antitoxin [Bacteroidales bacterium]
MKRSKKHTLNATIECLENGYSAYIENLDGVVATGSTVDEIKKNLISALDDYVETCKELNIKPPIELTGNYQIDFSMDVKSLLALYDGIFTKSGLERLTGINQKQLWHYANGLSKPRRAQVLKIENALHRLGNELIAIHL